LEEKKMKKFVSIVFALTLIMSMCINVFAQTQHSIKVTGGFTKLDGNQTAYIGYNINGYDAYLYKFEPGDVLVYEVMLETNMGGIGHLEIQGSKLMSTDSDDNEVHDWKFLRSTGVSDQNGINMHPESNLTEFAYKKWYQRKIEIPATFVGYSTRHIYIMAQVSSEIPEGDYEFYIRNVKITDGSGNLKLDILSNNKKFIAGQRVESSGVATMKLTAVNEGSTPTTTPKPTTIPAPTATPGTSNSEAVTSEPENSEEPSNSSIDEESSTDITTGETPTESTIPETSKDSSIEESVIESNDKTDSSGTSPWIWILIVVALGSIAGAAIYFIKKNKK